MIRSPGICSYCYHQITGKGLNEELTKNSPLELIVENLKSINLRLDRIVERLDDLDFKSENYQELDL